MTPDFEPYRRELQAHCYRMLGSADEAEDVVQETFLRALRGYPEFEGRSSVRTWLYRIATNACLTAVEQRGRRPLPSGLGGPSDDPYAEPELVAADWLQPLVMDPAAQVVSRESLRLALVASLQYLPGRQRAVLILREVLGFPAAEVAEMLGVSVAAVKSMLQRARAGLASPRTDLVEPTDPAAKELLAQYIHGFEHSDVQALERALRTDAALEMVGSSTWFAGKRTCVPYLATVVGSPGDWRMIPIEANGQPAVATYYRNEPFGIAVLSIAGDGITRIVVWANPELVSRAVNDGPPHPPTNRKSHG
jgi:RNA polymerase sigma-70 factor (ECF subfamily)